MRRKVFISYRRDDARADARSIYQRLQRSFGSDQLFMDVDSIPLGKDFRELLDRYLKQCKVMLVVIGQGWLDARDEIGKRRIEDPTDFVRIEVAMALARKVAVIPVLVDGAKLPKQDDLPNDLKPLVFRQSASVRHETFARDLDVLEKEIRRLVQPAVQPQAIVAALALIGLSLAGWWLWPQMSARLLQTSPSAPVGSPATFGTQSSQLANWRKEVQQITFKVEESPNIGRPVRLADRVKRLSNGQIELAIEPRSQIDSAERLEALSKGTSDAVWELPVTLWRRSSALAIYSGNIPMGLDGRRMARWLSERGVRDLNRIYQERLALKLTALPCYINPAKGFWLRKPVSGAADLKGLTIRTAEFFSWRVTPKLGLKPVDLPSRAFAQALHKGAVDGGELSHPQFDADQGLGAVGLQYYFPGFHAPALVSYLHFNTDRWNALPAATRGLIEEACRAQLENDLQTIELRVDSGLVKLKAQGATVRTFPPDVLTATEQAMREVVNELSAQDPDFRAAWASYNAYR